jgi:hypothetical protein
MFLALPLFNSNLHHPANSYPGGRAYITLDPVYAHFVLDPFSQDNAGLWRNTSDPSQAKERLVNYLLVFNVTSYCNVTVYMDKFEVYAAQHADTTNTRMEIAQSIQGRFLECSRITNGPGDRLNKVYPTSTRWEPYESKLVAFSGTIEVRNVTTLQTGTFYLGGEVNGTPIDGVPSLGAGSKQIQTTHIGNEFFYNSLLGPNQILRFGWSGQIAYVDEAQ